MNFLCFFFKVVLSSNIHREKASKNWIFGRCMDVHEEIIKWEGLMINVIKSFN